MKLILKDELQSFIAAEDFKLCGTLTSNRPCTLDEFARVVVIFATKMDKKLYGRNLLDRDDGSNRRLALNPEAVELWNSKERIGLEKNKQGFKNDWIRHFVIEYKECSVNNKIDENQYDLELMNKLKNVDINEWKQADTAKSNRRKISSLIDRNEKAWWHTHFLATLPVDSDHYNYRRFQRLLERTWSSIGSDRQFHNLIGSCMVKPINDDIERGKCIGYITKQINSNTFERDFYEKQVAQAFYFDRCSNTGSDRQFTALEQAQRALRQQSAISTHKKQQGSF